MTHRPLRQVGALSARLGLLLLLAGCASSASRSQSTTSKSSSESRLTQSQVQRVDAACHDAERPEDQNVVTQFATQGARIFTPAIARALRDASARVAHEGIRVLSTANGSASGLVLARDITAESQVLRRSASLQQARSDQTELLTVLHHRITAARAAGVPGCQGAAPSALPNTAAP